LSNHQAKVARSWDKLHDEAGDESTFHMSAIDARTLTDSDGGHFSLDFEYDKHQLGPFIGEADGISPSQYCFYLTFCSKHSGRHF